MAFPEFVSIESQAGGRNEWLIEVVPKTRPPGGVKIAGGVGLGAVRSAFYQGNQKFQLVVVLYLSVAPKRRVTKVESVFANGNQPVPRARLAGLPPPNSYTVAGVKLPFVKPKWWMLMARVRGTSGGLLVRIETKDPVIVQANAMVFLDSRGPKPEFKAFPAVLANVPT